MTTIASAMNFGDWTFRKTRPVSKSSDDYSDDNRIPIEADSVDESAAEQTALQERYLSSEEDLSPTDSEFDDTISLGEEEPEIMEASVVQPVAVGRASLATMVSLQLARPMMVSIPKKQPATQPIRSSSLARPVSTVNSVPLLKTPTPRKHQLATVRNASSPSSSPELIPSPQVPSRSTHRPTVRPFRAPTAPSFLERDPCPIDSEHIPPTPPASKALSKMRGIGRSLSISKKVVEPLRKTGPSEFNTGSTIPESVQSTSSLEYHSASVPQRQSMARGMAASERPPLPADNNDYGTPRARRQLRRRRSTLSLIVV